MDMSDDVSALSMDGASAIAGNVFARRLRKDFAEMQLGIPEHEEQQGGTAKSASATGASAADNAQYDESGSKQSPLLHELLQIEGRMQNDGEELLEPFPKTFEEWQKKKHKKHKKHKHKHKSKSSSRSGRSSKHRDKDSRDKEKERQERQEFMAMGESSSSSLKTPPIMEISIQSSNFEPSPSPGHHSGNHSHLDAVDSRSYHSSIDDSNASSHSHSHGHDASSHPGSHPSRRHAVGSSLNGSGEAGGRTTTGHRAGERSLRSSVPSLLSADSRENTTYMTAGTAGGDSRENTTYMTGNSRVSSVPSQSQSFVTAEDLQTLAKYLEQSRADEKQVLNIYARLEGEVQSTMRKAEKAKSQREAVEMELNQATSEREELQKQLGKLEEGNERLRSRLRTLEDRETEEGLDDVLDSMEAKIKALKLKGRRTKERRPR